jgi:hypothetical protein
LQYNASGLEKLSVFGGAQQTLEGSGRGGFDHANPPFSVGLLVDVLWRIDKLAVHFYDGPA